MKGSDESIIKLSAVKRVPRCLVAFNLVIPGLTVNLSLLYHYVLVIGTPKLISERNRYVISARKTNEDPRSNSANGLSILILFRLLLIRRLSFY